MSTQYDAIASGYSEIYANENDPASQFEEANLHTALAEHIKGARILDLACGTGHYSRKFLEWGAKSVVGVDISSQMVEEARKEATKAGVDDTKLSYMVGDAFKSPDLSSKGAPFDLVTGCWLLNYAPDVAGMDAMWRTISNNLKAGGIFVGLTIPPPYGNQDELNRVMKGEWAKFGTSGHVTKEVQDGFAVHIVLGHAGSTQVEFDNYYLRNEVFEKTAKSGGMNGGFEWQPLVLPKSDGHPKGFWNDLILSPHCRVCMAWK